MRLLTPLPAPSAMMLAQDVLEPASSGQASPTLNGGDTEKTLPQFPLSQASGASRSLVTGKPQRSQFHKPALNVPQPHKCHGDK